MSTPPKKPVVAIIACGEMGAGIAARLVERGCTVLTDLTGRSSVSRARADGAGMVHAPLADIAARADWVLSILPPSDARALATAFVALSTHRTGLRYADCNAVSPDTARQIGALLAARGVPFVDAGILGGPPRGAYGPAIYASAGAAREDQDALKAFGEFNQLGLQIYVLGEGAGCGDASAVKLSYAGIMKGTTGLFALTILAAHANSPATATALMEAIGRSQPALLQRAVSMLPSTQPKAYRFVGEMEELAAYVRAGLSDGAGDGAEEIFEGMARLYSRMAASVRAGKGDVEVLDKWVADAKEALAAQANVSH